MKHVVCSRTPVEVMESVDYTELKHTAFEKLKRYVPELSGCKIEEVELVYKSSIVAYFIPGTTRNFILRSYKEELGCKYSQVILYLRSIEGRWI